mmetsp:Transcript_4623/g.10907  ORF Transcript_4623/g.10907 Transcript_4623/m.10907 type:complete len:541 (-) Transcript_4623:273-1895(-)
MPTPSFPGGSLGDFVEALDRRFERHEDFLRQLLLDSKYESPSSQYMDSEKATLRMLSGTEQKVLDEQDSKTDLGYVMMQPELDSWKRYSQMSLDGNANAPEKEPSASGFLDMYNNFLLTDREPLPRLKAFVLGPLDWYMGLVVVVNVVLMIWQTELMGERAKVGLGLQETYTGGPEDVIDDLEYVFFSIYLLDVLIRVVTLRLEWMYHHIDGVMYMNLMDATLVLISAIELFLLPALSLVGDETDQSTRGIRILKLMRIFRALRIVKTVNLFHPLRVLLSTCIASIGALFWSMTLMLVLKLGFSLLICQAIHPFLLDPSLDIAARLEIYGLYGNFWYTMYTMFEITHSGGWPLLVRPVLEKLGWGFAVPFLIYVTLVIFAVIRIVTALFLKETLTCADDDAAVALKEKSRRTRVYKEKLREVFLAADKDGDGNLTPEEFFSTLGLPKVRSYLSLLEVNIKDCDPLFEILDDGDGVITIEEFCKGILHLKGQASALDIIMLQRENRRIQIACHEIRRTLKNFVKVLQVPTPVEHITPARGQ